MSPELRIEKVEPEGWPRVKGVEQKGQPPSPRRRPQPKPSKEAPSEEDKGLLDRRA